MTTIEMQVINSTTLPIWLKNVSEGDLVDVLDKGTTDKYTPKWMLGKINKLEYEIGSDCVLIPIRILIHFIGWAESWNEWFDLKKKLYIDRLSERYTKVAAKSSIDIDIDIGSFIDVKINSEIVKEKFVCNEFSCSSCIKDKSICNKNKIHLNAHNLWRIGKIIQKNSENIIIYVAPSHVCWNNHKYICKSPIILNLPLQNEYILQLDTHTKNHCKNIFCKGCEYPQKSLANVPWPSVIKNTLDQYFKKYPNAFKIDKKYIEKHCPVCWSDFDDETFKPIWFECGHSVCNHCFDELCRKKTVETLNCVYCRKKLFQFGCGSVECYDIINKKYLMEGLRGAGRIEPIDNIKCYILEYNYTNKTPTIQLKYAICIRQHFNMDKDETRDKQFKNYLFAQFGSKIRKDRLKISNCSVDYFHSLTELC